jgi:uncharacterized protein
MIKKILIILCCVSALLLAGVHHSTAASFDCSSAATKPEKLICSDQQLSSADDELAKTYRRALESSSDKEGLKKQQQNWIKTERNTCRDVQSMLSAYKSRITILKNNTQKSVKEALQEANEHFTFQGKPINPRMLNDLLPWPSDILPGPIAVDIQGGSNRYYAEITVPKKGIVRATWKEENDELSFQYQHLGVLANGMHVIKTMANSGGSGTFIDLLLVRFLVDTEYQDGGMLRSRLVLIRTGVFILGAGYDGSIKVQSNQISIGPGGAGVRENAKIEVINFK